MTKTFSTLFFLLIAVLAGALWAFLLYNVYSKQHLLAVTATEISNLQMEGTKLASMRSLAEDVSSNINKLDQAFVKKDEAAMFVEELERVADSSDVKVSISDLSIDEKKEGIVKQLRVRAEVNGTKGAVVGYLKNIESLRRLIVVNQVSITEYESDKRTFLSRATFDLIAYVTN